MNGLLQVLRGLGPTRLGFIALVTAGLFAFFAFLISRVDTPPMALLFGGLNLQEASSIANKLDSMKVPYQVGGNGTQILVPENRVLKLRLTLAHDGLPAGGTIGYEIFDHTSELGTTRFIENIDRLRALEGELARTIDAIQGVAAARVNLVLPQRQIFVRNQQKPSASILLKMQGAERLDASQVAAVENLVAAAVPGLNPSRVVIVDNHGQLLSQLSQGGDAVLSGRLLEQRLAIERRLKYRIQSLLEPSLGIGNVRAEVSVALNRSSVTVNQELFDPNGQVARSTQTTTHDRSTTNAGPTSVSVANNLPTSKSQNNGSHQVSNDKSETDTTNYEISKTVRNDVTEPGAVSRLSVAVLVNDTKTVGPNGKVTYQPRSATELRQISNLVESAIGYDAKRGDQVQVVSMRFANNPSGVSAPPAAFHFFGLGKSDLLRLAETLIISVVGLLVLLLVVRPMVLRTLSLAPAMAAGTPAGVPQLPPGLIPPALAAPSGGVEQLAPQPESEESRTDAMIDIARVEGQVRASSVKKVGEIVERHPEQAVTIVRSWLSQGSEGR